MSSSGKHGNKKGRVMEKYVGIFLATLCFLSPAWADAIYECQHLDLQGTRLRVAPSVKEPFSRFQRPTAGYRLAVKDSGAIEIWDSMPNQQWKLRAGLKVSPIDPVSGTAVVTNDRPGLLSVYILETRGDEIAVLATTVERSTGAVGTSSVMETMTGICKRLLP
jgi:hypothetical protein